MELIFLNASVDVDSLLARGLNGTKIQLSLFPDTTINLGFGFVSPLTSGTPLYNITVSANGVCYVPGTNLTNGWPNENFLAPLLGAYDTTRQDSQIAYVTDGSKFTVEWRNMVLRQQTQNGSFTFQMSINNQGTVWFLYKTIPVNFNATTYTTSTGQKLIISGTDVTVRDPLTGQKVASTANYARSVQAQTGTQESWTVSGVYTLADITTTTTTIKTTATSNPLNTPKKTASLSKLSSYAAILSFSALMYTGWLGK